MPVAKIASFIKRRLPFFRPPRDEVRLFDIHWMVEAYAARLKSFGSQYVPAAASSSGKHAAILVTPWLRTPVPMYSMETGLGLARAGQKVTFLWDQTNVMGNAARPSENRAIASLFDKLPPSIKLVEVKSGAETDAKSLTTTDLAWAESLLRENGIAFLRQEKGASEFVEKHRDCIPRTAAHLERVTRMLSEGGYDLAYIPGGIYGLSALYLEACKRAGVTPYTYDAGNAILVVKDGVATHQTDIQQAHDLLVKDPAFDAAARARVIQSARDELSIRMQGRGYTSQIVAAGQSALPPCDVLVPLNLRWDSAALWRMNLFPTVEAWIRAIAEWARAHPTASVCFRQHPCERDPASRGNDDVAGLLHELDPEGRQLHFVRAEDPVNTYDLVQASRVVLPFTSTVGVESAMFGKPIVLHTRCYYDGFSFAQAPKTVDQYFARLTEYWETQPELAPSQRDEAAFAYYLAQICLYLYTPFSPVNHEYQKWVAMTPEELWSIPENEDLLTALTNLLPVPYVRHRRKFRELA